MIRFNEITLMRGEKCLLDDASLNMSQQGIVGVIGRNGAGKSSLFSFIQGDLEADSGVYPFPAHATWSALSQTLPHSDEPLLAYACNGDKQWEAVNARLNQAQQNNDGLAIAEAYATIEEIDGYSIESRAAALLVGLGFSQAELNQPLNIFSGGWQMRAQLARVMISRADLLLLDEPTNHLDLESVAFLANWLKSTTSSALIISHERDFLDQISSHILHLSQKKLKLYTGNYTSFTQQLNESLIQAEKTQAKILQKRAHMQSFVDRFRYKASKAKQAQSRLKALEKLQFSETLSREQSFAFSFSAAPSLTNPVITIAGDLGYPNKTVIQKVNWSLGEQSRIGILGVNGAGKSTFLSSLAKQLPLIQGQVTWHPKLKIGYYSQQQLDMLDLDQTPYETLNAAFPDMSSREIHKALAQFQFDYEKSKQRIRFFSGGERARLALALLVWQRPNCLILDEPTNHLDMQMREALIMALQTFTGCVLLVSHDKYLLDCITDSLLFIKDGGLHEFDGSLDDYTQAVLKARQASTKSDKPAAKKSNQGNINKKTAALDKRITQLNRQLNSVNKKLSDPEIYQDATQQDAIKRWQTERETVLKTLDKLNNEWLNLID